MAHFFEFLRVFAICGTVLLVVMLVLLSLPQSKLRSVGLEMAKWALMCGLILMLPSPIDVVPDVVPVIGWLDDIGYLLGAFGAGRSALGEREKRRLYEEIELAELRSKRNEVGRD